MNCPHCDEHLDVFVNMPTVEAFQCLTCNRVLLDIKIPPFSDMHNKEVGQRIESLIDYMIGIEKEKSDGKRVHSAGSEAAKPASPSECGQVGPG